METYQRLVLKNVSKHFALQTFDCEILLYIYVFPWLIATLVKGRAFGYGAQGGGFDPWPGLKMVHDAPLLNAQQLKRRIEG